MHRLPKNKQIPTRCESANKSKKPPQTEYMHDNSRMVMLHNSYMDNNGLIHGYITGIHFYL